MLDGRLPLPTPLYRRIRLPLEALDLRLQLLRRRLRRKVDRDHLEHELQVARSEVAELSERLDAGLVHQRRKRRKRGGDR